MFLKSRQPVSLTSISHFFFKACTRWRYDVINNDSESSSLNQVLNHMYELDPDQLYRRQKGSLPIHMALFGGQSWPFLQSMVFTNKKLVGMRDAQTKLFPFQIAALPIQFRNVQLLMRCQFAPTEWQTKTLLEKKTEYGRVTDEHETRQVCTIFELLRKHPDAIEKRPLYKDSSDVSQNPRSLSKLAMHYLSWVYGRSSKGKYRVRYENLAALRHSIVQAKILPELEPWWRKLKECIWEEAHGDIPKTADYLLHAALHNSENPPLVTELLLQIFPSSTAKPIPGTSTFPLHICAGTMAYQRQHFEVPYGLNNLPLVLKAYKEATRIRSNGRLPLHICLARGKDWKEEVRPLIMVDPSSLKVEDPLTGLFPFELAASFKLSSKENSLWYSTFIEKEMRTFDFHRLSTQEKALSLSKARKRQELNQLTCIFELIRHRPSALSVCCSEFMIDGDDDVSVNSLFSLVDDDYEMGDSWEQSLTDFPPITPQANNKGLLSQARSSTRSMYSLVASSNTPSLITPHDGTRNRSLSAYLFHNENDATATGNYSLSSSSFKNISRGKKPTKVSMDSLSDLEKSNNSISTGSFIKKGEAARSSTKMFNISDLSGLNLSDDEQLDARTEARGERAKERAKILRKSNKSISTSNSTKKGKAARRPTKMSMFDISDLSGLNLSDDEKPDSSMEANDKKTRGVKIPVALPDLEVDD